MFAKCRLIASLQGTAVCTAWELNQQPADSPKYYCKSFVSKHYSEAHARLFRFVVFLWLLQMRGLCVRPLRVWVNVCLRKCFSCQTIRRRLLSISLVSQRGKECEWGFWFQKFMNIWIHLKDYNLSSVSQCHTALGNSEQPALMCKGQHQKKTAIIYKYSNKAVHMYYS